ncbi:pectinesterase [Trifolium repens]|nr:pectinesterase [Trifolium repens]
MSATFQSSPPNVVLSDITFKNTFGYDGPAVAASIYGDKTAIFKCSFIGYQDTLLSATRRQYFKNCYIQGEVDFICGDGQSYFENCVMHATQGKSRPLGFVTAQHRDKPNEPSGYVFRGGAIVGNGQVNLGRPWGPYAKVIFWGTYFSSVVTPQGWTAWNDSMISQEQKTTFAEVNCRGPGADTKERVKWEKKPKDLNLKEYTLTSFINNDGWLANIPSI